MKDWKLALIRPTDPVIDAIRIIDKAALQIALVVDENHRLLGTVTDGDIRRAILQNISFESQVEQIMYKDFSCAKSYDSNEDILEIMNRRDIKQIPIVDNDGRVVGLKTLGQIHEERKHNNWIILMAGGLGNRLRPLTDECPKPLLEVGGKPVLETIINNFRSQGFCQFFIALNYKAKMIENYFGDGSQFHVDIKYLKEKEKLGTAGALGLLDEQPNAPLILMNGDLLTKVDFNHLLNYHLKNKSAATMCVRQYDFQVPYGIVKIEKQNMVSIEEKPVHSFFVNAGIYILEPDILDLIPKNKHSDMPDILQKITHQKNKVSVFPIHEYWIDIGKIGDFQQAANDFDEIFT